MRSDRGSQEAQGVGGHDERDQAAADQSVPEGDEEEQAQEVADLGGGDDQGRAAFGDTEVFGDEGEQGLGVVEVGHCHPASQSEERHPSPGHHEGATDPSNRRSMCPRYRADAA